MSRRNVYDKVWTMIDNRPREMLIYAVVEEMGFDKQQVVTSYRLVPETMGALWSTSIGRSPTEVYDTKQQLLETL